MPRRLDLVGAGRNRHVGKVVLRAFDYLELAFCQGDFVGVGQGVEAARIGEVAGAGVVRRRFLVGDGEAGAEAGGDGGLRRYVFEHNVEGDRGVRMKGAAGDTESEANAVFLVGVYEGIVREIGKGRGSGDGGGGWRWWCGLAACDRKERRRDGEDQMPGLDGREGRGLMLGEVFHESVMQG